MSRLKIMSVALFFIVAGMTFISACSADDTGEHVHNWVTQSQTEATCGQPGIIEYSCSCGEVKTEKNGAATGAHSFSGNVCMACSYVDMTDMEEYAAIEQFGYYHVDEDGSNTITTNDKIYFGSYPQSLVGSEAIVAVLESQLNANGWTSYGYYVEGTAEDIMFWQDVTLDGVKYRAVRIDEYRPSSTYSDVASNYISLSGYSDGGTVYWFEYSPIEWRVLDYMNGEAFLNSVKNLDAQAFSNIYVNKGAIYYSGNDETKYANDWENSDIRAWLNGTFMNWAFSESEQSLIEEKTLDNSSTSYDASQTFSKDQNGTTDKIYLLSYSDVLNSEYGFPSSVTGTSAASVDDPTVCKVSTAYSESQGIRKSTTELNEDGEGCSWWMLRSAGGKSFSVCGVTKYGTLSKSQTTAITDADAVVTSTNSGISPAITIKLGK